MDLQDLGMECIELAEDRDRWWALVNAVMSFSRRALLHGVHK